MSIPRFAALCEGLCDLLDLPRVPPGAAADGGAAIHLKRDGVMVNLMHFPQHCESHAILLFDFGPIPYGHPRLADILLALLDANFVIADAAPPSLARNPANGDVVLRYALPLAETAPEAALARIDLGVALALGWREGHFLAPTGASPLPAEGPAACKA